MENQLLTEKQAADRLLVLPSTMKKWRSRGRGPRYCKLLGKDGTGSKVRYRASDIDQFIVNGIVEPQAKSRGIRRSGGTRRGSR